MRRVVVEVRHGEHDAGAGDRVWLAVFGGAAPAMLDAAFPFALAAPGRALEADTTANLVPVGRVVGVVNRPGESPSMLY